MGKYSLYASLVFLATACSEHQVETTPPTSLSAETPATPVPAATSSWLPSALPETLAPTAVPEAQVPAAQRLPGRLVEAWRWTDVNGENLLVVYRTDEHPDVPLDPNTSEDPASKVLYDANGDTVTVTGYREYQQHLLAGQYVRQPGQPYTELWRLRDEVRHCAVGLYLALLPHTTSITDLDQDGQTETTLLYVTTCRNDFSPDDLHLILHEGPAKYTLRGYTVAQLDALPARQRQPVEPCCLDNLPKQALQRLDETPHAPYMGRYFTEADFRQQPAFLRFARQQWQRYSVFDANEQAQ